MKTKKTYLMVLLCLVLAHAGAPAAFGEYRMETGIGLSEEFNDNVFLTPQNQTRDYITRVVPSIHLVYSAPAWDWDFAYAFDYRYYAEHSVERDWTQDITLGNHTTISPDRLFLDVKDVYRRVSLNTVQDYTKQSLFFNQTDENIFTLAPYVHYRLASHTTGTAGYDYRNLWYRETGAVNSTDHTLHTELYDELSGRTTLTGGVKYVNKNSSVLSYDRVDIFAGPRYEYAEGSVLWVILGNSWFDSDQLGRDTQGFWDVGLTHRLLTYVLTLNAALTYVDDPERVQRREDRYTAALRKEGDRLTLGATVGWWEYRNVLTKHLQESRYGLAGTVGYQFTTDFNANYALNIDRYDDNQQDTFSMVYLNAVRLQYLFPSNTTLALDYRFEHGYSPDVVNYSQNFDNNRVVLEIRKIF